MQLINKFNIVALLSFTLLVASCASVKNKKETKTDEVALEATSRLIVSFYSPGNGIDRKAKAKFDTFLSDYKPTLAYSSTKWGREGEIDYCFDLKELSPEQQEAFVASAKELLSGSKKVRFSENELCRNLR